MIGHSQQDVRSRPQPCCVGALRRQTVRLIALGFVLAWHSDERVRADGWVAPSAVVSAADGRTLYLAGARGRLMVTLEAATGREICSAPLDEEPTGLALSADGAQLAVTCSGSTNLVVLLDASTGELQRRLWSGPGVCSPVFSRASNTLYVCLRFANAVAVIDLITGRERARVPTGREPVAVVLTPDGRWLVVAHHLPEGPANRRVVAAAVTVVDTASFTVRTNLVLPNGSVLLRGVAISPSGKWAAVTHNVARFQVPTTQVEHGWMNDSALSLLSLETLSLKTTLLLDEPTRGAANPWAVAWTPDEHWLCLTHSGTHELSVINVAGLLGKLADVPAGKLIDDLTFLQGVRRRVPLAGDGPRCLAVRNDRVWVGGFFSDSVDELDLRSGRAQRSLRLSEDTRASGSREGERLFHDATISHQSWQSCASCHPDGPI